MAWTRCCRTPCRARQPPSEDRRARRPAAPRSGPTAARSATPSVAITTPSDLRAVSASLPSAAPTSMVSSGSVDSASAPRAAVVKIREALNSSGNSGKEQHAEAGHRGPVPARRPAGALQQRHRQQQHKADAEPERADGKRIDRVHQITGGADRSPAERRSTKPPPERPRPLPSAKSPYLSSLRTRVRERY